MSTATHEAPKPATGAQPRQGHLYGLLAEFDNPAQLVHAAEKVRDAGYRYWDCHTPFPVHGLDQAMGVRRTILPVLVFMAGATGTLTGLGLQCFTNGTSLTLWALVWVTGYPFLISGKPLLSIPAFIPIVFELTVLFSVLSTVGLVFLLNGLPRLHHPLFRSDRFLRATDDKFFISIEARDPRFYRTKTEQLLKSLGAASVEAVED
ncbi:MAG: DUF3341 domain-containing protein [Phycisphaerales bacterium]